MTRNLDALTSRQFDVLVIGGGIQGLMIAWDAATRGLHVALVERHDLGSGASFHHHRTLHGGLRYLQRGDLVRLRESIRERRTWARIAPHFIAPQTFAVEAGGDRGKPSWLLRLGFLADRVFSADRNRGLAAPLQLPAPRIVTGAERAAIHTGDLLGDHVALGLWSDYRTEHAERLTFAVAHAASNAGAVLANYIDALEPIRDGRKVAGIVARDAVGGERLQIGARVTINATGAAAGRFMAACGIRRTLPLVKAMNLVTRYPAPPVACGAPTRHGRLLFALPWQGRLSIGTWHGAEPCGADAGMVSASELESFLTEIAEAFPRLPITLDDIALVQRGVVPAVVTRGGVELADRPLIREHRQDGVDGVITVMGVKYTTARAVAEEAVTLALAQMGTQGVPLTTRLVLPGGEPNVSDSPARDLDAEAWRHLQRVYGTEATRVARTALLTPALGERIVPHLPIVGAQIVEAVRNEMALTLEDVVLRRTGLGSAGYPGDEAILRIERLVREELGWTSARVADEIQQLKEFYLPLHV
jgi:glycerol-3-phosphate dehydrogenase